MQGPQAFLLTHTRLPLPPWSSCRSGRASSEVNTTQKTSEVVRVPLLHFKHDAFNFIKRNLGSPSKETGDSVMATISCLMFLEAASWEVRIHCPGPRTRRPTPRFDLTSVDKPGCPLSGSHALEWACYGGKPPLWPNCHCRTDHLAKVPGNVSKAAVTAPNARAC